MSKKKDERTDFYFVVVLVAFVLYSFTVWWSGDAMHSILIPILFLVTANGQPFYFKSKGDSE